MLGMHPTPCSAGRADVSVHCFAAASRAPGHRADAFPSHLGAAKAIQSHLVLVLEQLTGRQTVQPASLRGGSSTQ